MFGVKIKIYESYKSKMADIYAIPKKYIFDMYQFETYVNGFLDLVTQHTERMLRAEIQPLRECPKLQNDTWHIKINIEEDMGP